MDNMGAGAQGVLTDAVLGSNPQLPGATGGAQTVSIAQANIPSYTLTGGSGSVTASGTTGGESQSHTHSLNTTSGGESSHAHNYTDASDKNAIAIVSASGGVVQSGYWRGTTTNATSGGSNHTHSVPGSTGSESQTHNHPVTVAGTASAISIASGGAGAALNKLNPIMTFMIYVRL
jgi:hypothetical protein